MYNVYKSVFYFKRGIFMLKDGTYDGEARGMAGFVKAKLTIKDKKLCQEKKAGLHKVNLISYPLSMLSVSSVRI